MGLDIRIISRITPEAKKQLEQLATVRETSESQVIRDALREELARAKEDGEIS